MSEIKILNSVPSASQLATVSREAALLKTLSESKLGFGIIPLVIFRSIGWGYSLTPYHIRCVLSRCLGGLLKGIGFRSKVVRSNLELCYPGESQKKLRDRIYDGLYRHLGFLFLELFMVVGSMKRFVMSCGGVEGLENWQKANAKGKGVLCFSAHLGNWEVMVGNASLHGGMEVMMATKMLKPRWLHYGIFYGRLKYGVSATFEPRTLKDIFSHLKKGKTIGIMLDQYAGPPIGVRVPFYGTPVSTLNTVAVLAKRTGAAVVPAFNYRDPGGKIVTRFLPECIWRSGKSKSEEIAINTAYYTSVIEAMIRDHPEQWLWTHRRFKGDLSELKEGEWSAGRKRG